MTLWKFWDIGTLKKSENFEFRNSGDRNFSLNPMGELGITGVWRVLEIEFWLNFGNLELKMIIWELGIPKKGRNFEFGSSELRSFRTNSPLKTSPHCIVHSPPKRRLSDSMNSRCTCDRRAQRDCGERSIHLDCTQQARCVLSSAHFVRK